MASRPNPSWTEPQKKVFNQLQEAIPLIIPYFGPEIPRLDNHTPEQLCDDLGVVKQAKKHVDYVEGILKERFRPHMQGKTELRGSRFEATVRGGGGRTILNQGKCKEFLERADELEVDLERLLNLVAEKKIQLPNEVFTQSDEQLNTTKFHTSGGGGASLYVEPIEG